MDKGDLEKALGVVEFIKFFMLRENQVDFILETGYLPIREDVIRDPHYRTLCQRQPRPWEIDYRNCGFYLAGRSAVRVLG